LRKPIIGGNWKMNKTLKEAIDLAEELVLSLKDYDPVEVVIFPPFTCLHEVHKIVEGTSIGLGAQNMFWEEKGAYTGEISPSMLVDVGCSYVILGHSERRNYFKETDAEINKKIKAALKFDLTPVVCVGEKLEERKKGLAEKVVESQLKGCFSGLDPSQIERVVIAYEPVWAIGTGETATPEQAQKIHEFIRKVLRELAGEKVANSVRVKYGGSVKPDNIKDLMAEEDIDGALVGGASLNLDSFIKIVKYREI